jgi:hypothetical protein
MARRWGFAEPSAFGLSAKAAEIRETEAIAANVA